MRIIEGDLKFGDFDDENFFHIEKTNIYETLSVQGVKSVEFILNKPEKNELLFVEGKTTLPSKGVLTVMRIVDVFLRNSENKLFRVCSDSTNL